MANTLNWLNKRLPGPSDQDSLSLQDDVADNLLGMIQSTDILWRLNRNPPAIPVEVIQVHGLTLPYKALEIQHQDYFCLLARTTYAEGGRSTRGILGAVFFKSSEGQPSTFYLPEDWGCGKDDPWTFDDVLEDEDVPPDVVMHIVHLLANLSLGFLNKKKVSRKRKKRKGRRISSKPSEVTYINFTASAEQIKSCKKKAQQILREIHWRAHTRTYWVLEENIRGRVVLGKKVGRGGRYLFRVPQKIMERTPKNGWKYRS